MASFVLAVQLLKLCLSSYLRELSVPSCKQCQYKLYFVQMLAKLCQILTVLLEVLCVKIDPV